MLNRKKSDLDIAIDECTTRILQSPDEEERQVHISNLERLHALRHDKKSTNRPSADVVLTVAANLLGIGMIVGHERASVVTSKALSFVSKLR